jgi:hypothetical protein
MNTIRTPQITHEHARGDADVIHALEVVQRAIFKYPLAIQAGFSALVAEGRAFAETSEGADWRDRLSRARALGRARMVWEVLSLSAFTEHYDGLLPGVFADTLVRALKIRHLEPALSKIFERRF